MNYWVACLGIGTKECQECSIRGVSQGECRKKGTDGRRKRDICICDSYIRSHHKRRNKRIMGVGNLFLR